MKKIFESKIFKNKKIIREEEDLVLNPLGDNVVVTDVTPLPANDTVFNAFQRNMEANGQDQEKAVAATSVELNMTVEQVIDAVQDKLNIPHVDVVNDNDADNIANLSTEVVAVVPAETVTGEPIVAVVEPEALATPEFYEVVANESIEFSLGAGKVLIVEKGEKIRILKESKINLSTKISNNSGNWSFYIDTDTKELVGYNGSITDGGQDIKRLIPDWNGKFDQELIDSLEEWLSDR